MYMMCVCERERVCEREIHCVCERERERSRGTLTLPPAAPSGGRRSHQVRLCVCEREREILSFVCERERKRLSV